MTYQLAFIGALIGIATFCALIVMIRHEQDAWIGRRLREAAGSRVAIERAITETATQRQLEERCARELEQALRYPRVSNVTPFRIVERGKPTRFEPGDAA